MSSPKRKRDVSVLFWVSADEMELIQQKMAQFGTKNLSAYLRKMAVDGYVVQLDLPELKELVSLLRRSSNNLNQLTRKVHETGIMGSGTVILRGGITMRALVFLLKLLLKIVMIPVILALTCSLQSGIILLVMAFLISPYGLPMAAIWLLGKVQDLKFAIQDLVYG